MNRGGIGVGSASIVLVFAVLCLSVFTLISLSTATSDKALTDAAVETVTGYYRADTLAEYILADILAADAVPETVRGVAVSSVLDFDTSASIASFSCPISDVKELYVEVAVFEDTYDILNWRMRDVGDWSVDDSLPVWPGDSGDISGLWSGEFAN